LPSWSLSPLPRHKCPASDSPGPTAAVVVVAAAAAAAAAAGVHQAAAFVGSEVHLS